MKRIFNFKLFVINEKRAQLNIPFAGTDEQGKMHHDHVLDAFEDVNLMSPNQYNSDANLNKLIDEAIPKAAESLEKEPDRMRDVVMDFLYQYSTDWRDIWDPEFLKENNIEDEDFEEDDNTLDLADKLVGILDNMKDGLTEEGKETWDEFFHEKIDDSIYAMVDRVEDIDEDGLIPIWRAITYTKGEYDDIYDEIIKGHHGGVGIYWAWEESGAVAHWGETSGDSKLFVLHGRVKPESVNWSNTILKNVYDLKEEEEIELSETCAVKLVGMTTTNENGKEVYVEFETAYVVKAGSVYRA